MAEDKIFNVQNQTDCLHDCPTVYDFLKLTDEMVKTIIELDECICQPKIRSTAH